MRVNLTPGFLANPPLPDPSKDRIIHWDTKQPGFGLCVTASGHKSFVCQYRAGHRSRRMSLKDGLTLQDARKEAKKHLGDVAKGVDPLAIRQKEAAKGADTFRSIAEDYIKREAKNVRSMDQRRAVLERLVYPKFGAKPIGDIRRTDIVRLLDRIEDERGAPMADFVLAVIRVIMSWHAARSDEFRSPIGRKMARTKPGENARTRILTDDELRAIWAAADRATGLFGPFVQFLLLTGTRRSEASAMARAEIADKTWTIPKERYKTKRDMVVPLSSAAAAALARLPKIGAGKLMFTSDGAHPFSGYSKAKAKFDTDCGVTGWTIHDLRRTARSLMSRAGVTADIAERCLGHVMPGVRGTYDRHDYFDEKMRAFEALHGQIARILMPHDNVIPLKAGRDER